ncbi:response regulator transcription factor [Nocardioides sp. BYT-33-1]|uniref:response regulator transcription factor n=1 Tax=Nocardioides sp. BYT-33-1 TaxID=3416952 RepID=UPI003F5389DB
MSSRPSPLDLVADVAAICVEPTPATVRATAVLHRIGEAIPLEAAALSTFDPVEERHLTIAEIGYSDPVLTYLNDGFVNGDPAFLTMRFRNPRPLRWCDIPNYRDMFSAHEVFIPGGFAEGSTTCLFTRDGRYTGALHLSSDSPLPISDSAVETLIALQRVIAPLMDAMRPPEGHSWTDLLEDAAEAALITHDRRLVALPGLRRDRWLADDSPLTAELLARPEGPPARFAWVSPSGRCHEVRTTRLATGVLVTLREAAAPYRLSPREVQVLTLVAAGLGNPAIGLSLSLSPRTVATHVEHILAKLGCATRVAAASKAVAEGIVPLTVSTPSTPLLART